MAESQGNLIRIATAGSVDDGKSTLIGRLFFDRQAIYLDHLAAIKQASANQGQTDLDLSLLTDGLAAEREQKITIDVAHIHFDTPRRKYLIADVPGHEQYTRNMITGASPADAVLILVDAQRGLTTQSKRHLFLAALMNVPHLLIVVNKIDLIGYQPQVFAQIKKDFLDYAARLNLTNLQFIPVSALKVDMVVSRGQNLPWYHGLTLFAYLENLPLASDRHLTDFRFPIQSVIRPHQSFRGYAGMIEGGIIHPGERVTILPSGQTTTVKSLLLLDQALPCAFCPQSIVLTLTDEIDASRGDMIVRENKQPEINHEINATICWLSDTPLTTNQSYALKHTTKICKCLIEKIHYRLNVENLHHQPAKSLMLNDIGHVTIRTQQPLIFDPYTKNRSTGSFILIDLVTNNTVAGGVIA